jgi:hypothetical protein
VNVVLACRGCCCGTSKHPGVDHDAQLAVLGAVAETHPTPCLGPCRWSNVVVAVDTDDGTQTWFGKVLDPADTAMVACWLAAPDHNPLPAQVHVEARPADAARALQLARFLHRKARA